MKRRTGVVASSMAALGIAVAIPGLAAMWQLTGDIGVHDPTIIQDGANWYVFSTGQGIQALRSTNGGAHWVRQSQVFPSPLSWWSASVPAHRGNDLWAPDVQVWGGRVWLYYSISTFGSNTSAIGLASKASLSASGGWRDDGLVIRSTSSNDYNAIDPNLTIDAAGQPWLAFGSFWTGIKLTRIDPATMKPTGALFSLASRSGGIEAPAIVYRSPYYYLFVSIDRCCNGVNSTYKITYGRSTSITGPYLAKNGTSMRNGGGTLLESGGDRWRGPGGQDVHGTTVLARHAYDATANGAPKLLINDLFWDSAGWPTYTGSVGPSPTPSPTPSGGALQAESASIGGGAVAESSNGGFNGSGYVNFPALGGTLQFRNVDGGPGGSRTLRIRFALGASGSRTGALVVNGAGQNVTFNSTLSWTTWRTQDVTVNLNGGTGNTIVFQSNGQDLANIDQIEIP
jgi:arabinan endo-1,5-alpha-L-arabinosidase